MFWRISDFTPFTFDHYSFYRHRYPVKDLLPFEAGDETSDSDEEVGKDDEMSDSVEDEEEVENDEDDDNSDTEQLDAVV